MCCFQRTGKEEIGLLLKSWQVGLALGLHCSPAQLCLSIRDWPAAQTQLQRARKGQGQWTLACKLFPHNGKGSAKQPESPEPNKFQWGKGGGFCLSVERSLLLGSFEFTSGAIYWAYKSACSVCLYVRWVSTVLTSASAGITTILYLFLCINFTFSMFPCALNDSCQHRLLKLWGSMHNPAVQGQVVWILCKDTRFWHLNQPIQTSKLKCNCSTTFQ